MYATSIFSACLQSRQYPPAGLCVAPLWSRLARHQLAESHEGDYVTWSADLPHRLTVAEDALILTIRWPSTSEDKKEPVQSGGTAQEELESRCQQQVFEGSVE